MAAVSANTLHLQSSAGLPIYHITSSPADAFAAKAGAAGGGGAGGASRRSARARARPLPPPRVQLLHDFAFPGACARLRPTPDGAYLCAVGSYPPQLRVYELAELGLKFQRDLDCHAVDIAVLESDWRKLALLRADRTLEFHARSGAYYKTRIPAFGRALALHPSTCDLYVATSGSEVYRMNLDEGRFMPPLVTRSEAGNSAIQVVPEHNVVAVGGEAGLEMYDPRCEPNARVAHLSAAPSGVTALHFCGLSAVVGTAAGTAYLYDIRSSRPLASKDQGYGLPIVDVTLHADRQHAISADRKSIKIWRARANEGNVPTRATIEPPADVNSVCAGFGASGLLAAACEDRPVHAYYVPHLGPAPRWCAFLDNLTEELADPSLPSSASATTRQGTGGAAAAAAANVYENFKFVTADELRAIGLERLVGTNLLRPYMHGYFMDTKLYGKAKAAAEPYAYDEWRRKRVREKIEAQRAERIVKKGKRRNSGSAAAGADSTTKVRAAAASDERFRALAENPEFALDEESERWRQLHPNRPRRRGGEESDSDEEARESDSQRHGTDEAEREESDDEDEDEALARVAREMTRERRQRKAPSGQEEQERKQERRNTSSSSASAAAEDSASVSASQYLPMAMRLASSQRGQQPRRARHQRS